MGYTESEDLITKINTNVFFKEFTFGKNEFYPSKSDKKELADNVLWLDDLLFIIQIKERNTLKAKESTDKWFKNKVLKKAKNQIKASLNYLNKYDTIKITNGHNQKLDIAKVETKKIHKIIIYKTSETLNDNHKNTKFYISQDIGNIHIFDATDYYWICWYLHTPSELDEYLNFRLRLYQKHKNIIQVLPEQYILTHFLNTEDETYLDVRYIETLEKLDNDRKSYDISWLIQNFKSTLIPNLQKSPLDYHSIIKEIAKLKRYELVEFKSRLVKAIKYVNEDTFYPPLRYTSLRTKCGFVIIPLLLEHSNSWKKALANFTAIYKYKRKLNKCLGVIILSDGAYFEIYWAYMEEEWHFDSQLEDAVTREMEFYGKGTLKEIERYKFK